MAKVGLNNAIEVFLHFLNEDTSLLIFLYFLN